MSKALGGTRDDLDPDRKRVRDPFLFLETACEAACGKFDDHAIGKRSALYQMEEMGTKK